MIFWGSIIEEWWFFGLVVSPSPENFININFKPQFRTIESETPGTSTAM